MENFEKHCSVQVFEKVVTLFNKSKTPTTQCLIICLRLHSYSKPFFVLCMSINIFITFSANTNTNLTNLKI